MRTLWLYAIAAGLGICLTTASAQAPTYQQNQNVLGNAASAGGTTVQGSPVQGQPTSMTPDQQARIDEILKTWETDGKALECLAVKFKTIEENVAFKDKTYGFGEAKLLKMPAGTYGIRLEIYEQGRDGKPDYNKLKRKYVFSGLWLYQYDPSNKVINSQTVQQNMKPNDGPFAFLFGLTATEAKKRFSLSIAQADQHWTWLKVVALTPQDQKDFKDSLLGVVNYSNAISPKDFPVRIIWRELNNNTQSWEITEVSRNDRTKVSPLDFTIDADKKAGWKVQLVPAPNGSLQQSRQPNGIVPAGGYTPKK